jgi:hypothetical protein
MPVDCNIGPEVRPAPSTEGPLVLQSLGANLRIGRRTPMDKDDDLDSLLNDTLADLEGEEKKGTQRALTQMFSLTRVLQKQQSKWRGRRSVSWQRATWTRLNGLW